MTNLEKLRTATPEQIRDMFCEDCDKCPSFIFERCDAGKNGFAEWLSEEAIAPKDTPKDAPKGWMKLKEEFCNEIGGCDKCPPSISEHCNEVIKAVEDWKKPQETKDAPRGWIKLKTTTSDIYINASKIAALTHTMRANGASAKAMTKVYTVGAEDNPWIVDESLDEVIRKIEKA